MGDDGPQPPIYKATNSSHSSTYTTDLRHARGVARCGIGTTFVFFACYLMFIESRFLGCALGEKPQNMGCVLIAVLLSLSLSVGCHLPVCVLRCCIYWSLLLIVSLLLSSSSVFARVCVAICGRRWYSEGKKTNKGAGHVSEDSGDDLRDHARIEALDSFAIDVGKALQAGGAKKKGGGKKGKGKGKKK